jgi:hypothetical protein
MSNQQSCGGLVHEPQEPSIRGPYNLRGIALRLILVEQDLIQDLCLFSPLTRKITRAALFRIGAVMVIRCALKTWTQWPMTKRFCSRNASLPGNSEAVRPSVPMPSNTRSNRGHCGGCRAKKLRSRRSYSCVHGIHVAGTRRGQFNPTAELVPVIERGDNDRPRPGARLQARCVPGKRPSPR